MVFFVPLLALSLAPTAGAWPPVCIEQGAETGVVDAGVVVNCGVHAWADVCVPDQPCARHDLIP